MQRRICLACDLKPDESLIAEYIQYHKPEELWPEITSSIRDAGVLDMEIYRIGNRLFMIMEVAPDYDATQKAAMDKANPKVQEWESLMWKFQQRLPWAAPGQKWVETQCIFKLPKVQR
ncbi:MAG: L-rhamnose mutarotase [Saprospiraceae bacterium]|nr:L-rhamnose mutarotase [Saprospiraceae bacterium]